MDYKKKSKQLKKEAEKLGYEIKLTHAQEILARLMGHKSRHSVLEAIKNGKSLVSPFSQEINKNSKKEYFYYEVHVFYSTNNGFSVFFRNKEELTMEDDVISKAYDLGLIDEVDMEHVDYVLDDMSKQDYERVIGYHTGHRDTHCNFCDQHYSKSFFSKGKDSESKCNYCIEREVVAYISTDDSRYDYNIYDVRKDLEEHYLAKTGCVQEIAEGNYGPDSHTDNLLYNSSNKLVRDVEEYLNVVNKSGTVGFGITIDEESFKKWWKKFNI